MLKFFTTITLCFLVSIGALIWLVFFTMPGLIYEANHASQFVRNNRARVEQANCTNYNGIMFFSCDYTIKAPDKVLKTSDFGLGRVGSGPIHAMSLEMDKGMLYTTSNSIDHLGQREAALASGLILALFMACILVYTPFKLFADAKKNGRSPEEQLRFGREMYMRKKR